MVIPRQIEQELKTTAKEYPVITIVGPRQVGKTILAKQIFPKHSYANLENPELRFLALNDPKTFLKLYPMDQKLHGIRSYYRFGV